MAEAIGIAAGVAGLITLAVKVAKLTSTFASDIEIVSRMRV